MPEIREEPFFFEHEGYRLFGILHISEHQTSGAFPKQPKGAVFCHPFAEEKALSHRVMVDFARFLCGHGYHVLRFDYRGCGDSEGDFEDATLKSRLSDIEKAIDVLVELTGVTAPVLLGLRFGGTLAIQAAEINHKVRALVLWEPVLQVKAYLVQFLRMQLMAEKFRDGRIRKPREELIKELKEGKCVDILGFMLAPTLFEECMKVDVLRNKKSFPNPVLIVAFTKQRTYHKDLRFFSDSYQSLNGKPELMHVDDHPFWVDPNNVFRELASWQGHEHLFQRTLLWLDRAG